MLKYIINNNNWTKCWIYLVGGSVTNGASLSSVICYMYTDKYCRSRNSFGSH